MIDNTDITTEDNMKDYDTETNYDLFDDEVCCTEDHNIDNIANESLIRQLHKTTGLRCFSCGKAIDPKDKFQIISLEMSLVGCIKCES